MVLVPGEAVRAERDDRVRPDIRDQPAESLHDRFFRLPGALTIGQIEQDVLGDAEGGQRGAVPSGGPGVVALVATAWVRSCRAHRGWR
jgi:hypothetical protein